MQANWNLTPEAILRWSEFVTENRDKDLPRRRLFKNVKREGIDLSKEEIWRVLVGCQVTTQQRSGPNTPASRFMNSNSPALSLWHCRRTSSVADLIHAECTEAGLRRALTISENLAKTFEALEAGEWKTLLAQLATLERNTTTGKERKVVDYILSGPYPGLGQKQSRNFIQWLGLSRYEVPIDSRVLKALEAQGANFVPRGAALTDPTVYGFVQELLHSIADKLDIYPCELDACIFASFDQDNDDLAEER
jgi:hypothetical protein